MELDKIRLDDINLAEYNPRRISEEDKLKLRNSLEHFGLVDPILINLNNNRIIGGHQRYIVLSEMLKEKNQYEMEFDLIKKGDVGFVLQIDDLKIKDENNEKALNIALNKISGEWDIEKLSDMFNDFEYDDFEIELTGFDNDEIDEILSGLDDELVFDDLFDDSEFENSVDKIDWLTKSIYLIEGEVWKIGNHELKVGKPDDSDYFKLFFRNDDLNIYSYKEGDGKSSLLENIVVENKDNKGLDYKN